MGEPAALDPYGKDASFLTYALVRPVFPTLYRVDPEGGVEPDLAESLERTASGVKITLASRSWSNDEPVTARDVVASIRRATPPSGFAEVTRARAVGERRVVLEGKTKDWEQLLARGTFVLPRGRLVGGNVSAGPFRFAHYQRGRRLVYEANESAEEAPLLDGIEVSFVQGTDLLIRLLADGKVEAAWLPSTVNLGARLDELGIAYDSRMGDERVALASTGSGDMAASVLARLNVRRLLGTFVRDEGTAAEPPDHSTVSLPSLLSLAVPEGDELLALMQRAIQIDLEDEGIGVELITAPVSAFYGPWRATPHSDLSLVRSFSATADAVPLASVASFVAWREEVHGMAVNPSLEGPLWNARDWSIEPSI